MRPVRDDQGCLMIPGQLDWRDVRTSQG
jgi:hypothetical protein